MPDVIIWMLYDERRVAYAKVKAHSIMFSKLGVQATGVLCGKTETIFMKVNRYSSLSLKRSQFLGPQIAQMVLRLVEEKGRDRKMQIQISSR